MHPCVLNLKTLCTMLFLHVFHSNFVAQSLSSDALHVHLNELLKISVFRQSLFSFSERIDLFGRINDIS